MLQFKQDLIRIGSYTLRQIDRPYHPGDPWEISTQVVYEKLKNEMQQRNRIMIMVYGYYLGELIQLSVTPRHKWQEFIQTNNVTNEYYFYLGSIRTYKLFEKDPAQIYQTSALSFRSIRRMKVLDYKELLQCNQDLNELIRSIDIS
jgi:hypothetical protein